MPRQVNEYNYSVHPQLRAAYRLLPTLPFQWKATSDLLNLIYRLQPKRNSVVDISISETKLNEIPVRIYRPTLTPSEGAMLWIHGGGFITGHRAMNDRECAAFSRQFGLTVISVGYRLAPKFPFPIALQDCFIVWQSLTGSHNLGIDTSKIIIAGQSAGGGLAATLVQKIRDEGGKQPTAQLLYYPMLDDRSSSLESGHLQHHKIWNGNSNFAAWQWYLGQYANAESPPNYSSAARCKSVAGLPATWIGVGDIDLFYQENCMYAERIRRAGIDCEFCVVAGAPHGFDVFAPNTEPSKAFAAHSHAFLRRILNRPSIAPSQCP